MRPSPLRGQAAKAAFYTLAAFWMLPLAIGSWWYRGGQYVLQFTWMDSLMMSALSIYFLKELYPIARRLVGSL